MTDFTTLITTSTALILTATAAVTDKRHGLIPNWLTLPPLLVMPLAQLVFHGPGAAAERIVSAAICMTIPLFLFWKGAMGGGDVKLFAALGVTLPIMTALEAQYAAYVCVAVLSLVQLSFQRRLWSTLRSTAQMARRAVSTTPAEHAPGDAPPHNIPMGPGIFIATAFTLAWQTLP